MKQLTCEMCGSNDLIKQDGVFVCQSCGCKYSVEEAKKMMVEGTVEVTGTVKIDSSGDLGNLLQIANLSLESKDYKAALEAADKALVIDFENYKAWEIKAKSIGWIDSSLKAPKCQEALAMAQKAIAFAPMDEKLRVSDELQTDVCLQTLGLINIYSQMNSLGQVMHRATFALLMRTYLEALELAYVTPKTLELNSTLIIKKLTTGNSFQEILFDGSIKDVQNEFNQGKKFVDEVKERQARGMVENELNYWRDFPQSVADKKEELLSSLENDLELWNSVNKKYTELSEEYKTVDAIVKQNQFSLFGEGAKLRKENKEKAHSIQAELQKIEDEYKQRKETHEIIERKVALLKSI